MKNIMLLLLMIAGTKVSGQTVPVNIIPQPVEIRQSDGFLELTKVSTIVCNKAEARPTAELLTKKLNTTTGFGLQAVKGKTGSVQLVLLETPDSQIGKEGYLLEGHITLRVITYRNGKPAGHLITLKLDELKKRTK
jgi:hypothetical protein